MRTRVTGRGQVSVPAEIRRDLHIAPNTMLEWIIEGSSARVIPVPANPITAFRGSGRKVTVDSLLRERRQNRSGQP